MSFVATPAVWGRELLSRYREAMSLGVLLSELRTFCNEFKGSVFEIKADQYIIFRLTKVLEEKGRISRNSVSTLSGPAYDRLVGYLSWMEEKGLVEFDERELMFLTSKANATYERLVDWIMEMWANSSSPDLKSRYLLRHGSLSSIVVLLSANLFSFTSRSLYQIDYCIIQSLYSPRMTNPSP